MMNTSLPVLVDTDYLEPFDDRIDILFRELELASKWQRPSVLLAVYSSEYVRADADIALENRLHNLGQSAYHIKIRNQAAADVSLQISELTDINNVVFFVEGLRWGAGKDNWYAYQTLNNRREFFIENQIRVVFWLTEKEAMDLAHFAPDYWTFRHRVIEFVDSPKSDQISPNIIESTWQEAGDLTDNTQDLDAKIALRTALLADLPAGNESTDARANLLLTLGILHWRKGDYEKATQFLNAALDLAASLEDKFFEALCFNALALVQSDLGKLEEAVQAYKNAIDLAPEKITPWNNLGHLYRKLGRHEEALAAFQKAIEQDGSDAVSWNGLGDLYHETKRNDEAIYAYLKALEFSPDYAHPWCGLGNTHMEEGQLDEALAAHQKAIEIDSKMVNSWLGLGNIYKQKGNNENASMAYRTALELDPKNPLVWNELGDLFYSAAAYDEAMRSYQKSIEFDQGDCLSFGNLASIYILKDLHADAIPLLLRGIELSQEGSATAHLWNQLGDAYRRLDDYDHAVAAYRKADELSYEKATERSEVSIPETDPQEAPSENLLAGSAKDLVLEPAKEDPSPSEVSAPAIPDQLYESFVPDEPDAIATKPDADFLGWLDGLASVLPVTPPSEMKAIDGSNPLGDDSMDAVKESETGDNELAYTADDQVLPDQNEASYSSVASADVLEEQIISNNFYEEPASFASDPSMETDVITDESSSSLSYHSLDNPADKETITYESALQVSRLDTEDTGQTQVSIDQKNAQIWNELGNIYYNTGAFEEAMHAFEMAIELDPYFGWSYNNLASIYVHQKKFTDAIPLYQKGLQYLDDDKDQALLWNRLGDAYRRLDDRSQAAAAYRKAMQLDPDNVSLLTRARFSLLGNRKA